MTPSFRWLIPVDLIVLLLAISSLGFGLPPTVPDQTTTPGCVPGVQTSREHFLYIMQTIADGWNTGNARLAASCFAQDAIYSAPPSSGRRGRNSLYEYFGGARGRALPMHMTWHNLLFDRKQGIGVGEYTFRYRVQTHGLVIVKISNGLIRNWREYETQSNLDWTDFIGDNRF